MANDMEDLNLVKSSLCTRDLYPFFSTTDSAVLDLHCHVLSLFWGLGVYLFHHLTDSVR